MAQTNKQKYNRLSDFYHFYLTEHQNPICRGLHFTGTGLLLVWFIYCLLTEQFAKLYLIPIIGYGFAWLGHAFFEKNKPATFQYPLYSLASDFIMFWHILTGQLPQKMKQAQSIIAQQKQE